MTGETRCAEPGQPSRDKRLYRGPGADERRRGSRPGTSATAPYSNRPIHSMAGRGDSRAISRGCVLVACGACADTVRPRANMRVTVRCKAEPSYRVRHTPRQRSAQPGTRQRQPQRQARSAARRAAHSAATLRLFSALAERAETSAKTKKTRLERAVQKRRSPRSATVRSAVYYALRESRYILGYIVNAYLPSPVPPSAVGRSVRPVRSHARSGPPRSQLARPHRGAFVSRLSHGATKVSYMCQYSRLASLAKRSTLPQALTLNES